jgi:hypothetical protein
MMNQDNFKNAAQLLRSRDAGFDDRFLLLLRDRTNFSKGIKVKKVVQSQTTLTDSVDLLDKFAKSLSSFTSSFDASICGCEFNSLQIQTKRNYFSVLKAIRKGKLNKQKQKV